MLLTATHRIATTLLILTFAPSLAQSVEVSASTPASGPTAAQPHEAPARATLVDDRGSSKSPLVVAVHESDSEVKERAFAEKHREQEATNSRNTMYFTGGAMLVGMLQLGFFYWQLRLMGVSVKDAELAARAAELNARAAIGIELPILRVTPPDLLTTNGLFEPNEPYAGSVNDKAPEKFSAVGLLLIKNHGRTPAFPTEIAVGWMVANSLPETPTYLRRNRLNHASVIKADEAYMADVYYAIELTNEEVSAAASDHARLWFYGCIYYTDFLHLKREARFCWRFANRNFDNVFYYFASDGEPPAAYTQSV